MRIADVQYDVTSMMTCRNIFFLSSSGDDLGAKKGAKNVLDRQKHERPERETAKKKECGVRERQRERKTGRTGKWRERESL